jgi:hypothetical protein
VNDTLPPSLGARMTLVRHGARSAYTPVEDLHVEAGTKFEDASESVHGPSSALPDHCLCCICESKHPFQTITSLERPGQNDTPSPRVKIDAACRPCVELRRIHTRRGPSTCQIDFHMLRLHVICHRSRSSWPTHDDYVLSLTW